MPTSNLFLYVLKVMQTPPCLSGGLVSEGGGQGRGSPGGGFGCKEQEPRHEVMYTEGLSTVRTTELSCQRLTGAAR